MKKKVLLFGSYVVVAALASCLTLAVNFLLTGQSGPSKLDQIASLIEERYIGQADRTEVEDAAAAAMVAATGDRWSYYIPADSYQAYREQSENAYVGIGITIQLMEDASGFGVVSVEADGQAAEAGMQPGDLMIAVDDQDVRQMSLDEVKGLVRGEEGTYVKITVLRQGDHRTFSVERRQVLTKVATFEMLDGDVGLITIVNFDERCAQETIQAIQTLVSSGAKKLIFDVRHNPGGYASEMVEVLDYLLPEGELFRMVSYKGDESVDMSDADCLDIPMVVLVNSGSYSAAEFFAAAMQEYGAAVVIGEPTTGKGFYQNTFRLSDGSALALSVGQYYTPKGISLEGIGIVPDVPVKVDDDTASAIYYGTLPKAEDPYIQEALRILNHE